ncbi:hypothetical protein [Burkholderia metallica]|nr:hypothetical protein [Burkholderia metallica]
MNDEGIVTIGIIGTGHIGGTRAACAEAARHRQAPAIATRRSAPARYLHE